MFWVNIGILVYFNLSMKRLYIILGIHLRNISLPSSRQTYQTYLPTCVVDLNHVLYRLKKLNRICKIV